MIHDVRVRLIKVSNSIEAGRRHNNLVSVNVDSLYNENTRRALVSENHEFHVILSNSILVLAEG